MLRNLGSVWLRTLVTIAVVFCSKPFVVDVLGVAHNDVWVTLNLIVGWLALVAAGVPMSTTRQVARRRAVDDEAGLCSTVASSMAVYTALGAAALVLGALLYPLYDLFYLQPKVPGAVQTDATIGFAVLVVTGAVTFSAQLHYGIFNGHQDFVRPNAIMTISLVLKLMLFLAVLPFWPSVLGCCTISLGVIVLEYVAGRILVRRRMPRIPLSLAAANRSEISELARFSAYALLLNLGIKLSFMLNGLILAVLGEEGTPTLYDAASSPILYLLPLVIAVGQVMMPKVAGWKERGETTELNEAFLKWAKLGTGLGLLPLIFLSIQAGPFLSVWMAAAIAEVDPRLGTEAGEAMTILVCGTVLFLPARGLAMPLLMGLGKPRAPAILFVAAGVLNLLLGLLLVPAFGMPGAAWATATASGALAMALLYIATKELALPLWGSLGYIFGKSLIAGTITAALLWLGTRWIPEPSWFELIVSGAGTCIVYGVLWLLWVARGDARMPLDRLPAAIRSRLP